MNYHNFIGLYSKQKEWHMYSEGKFAGIDEQGDKVYQLGDFWVTVRENTKGFYYEARVTRPEIFALASAIPAGGTVIVTSTFD